jgi:hypothetical protein
MRDFMISDATRGLRCARANYLVALGLLTYIEAVGGLITGNSGIPYRYAKTNFNAALGQMLPAYSAFQVTIQRPGMKAGSGIYDIFRCGMVHQYAPVDNFMVWANQSGRARPNRLGFEWEPIPGGSQRLAINTNELLRDLKALLAKVTAWISTKDPHYYPLIKRSLERIDGFTVHP